MRWLIIIAIVAIALMFWGGWIYLRNNDDTSQIVIDKGKVHEDTQVMVEEGRHALEKAAQEMKKIEKEGEQDPSKEAVPAGKQ